MCGIVGYIGSRMAAPILLNSLKKLEYRGYDSAGVAVLDNGVLGMHRCEGKLENLEWILSRRPLKGFVGIGHTRWATHGRPSEINAHPHRAGSTVVVHNGIIENYIELRDRLVSRGTIPISETDTEIVAHLVEEKMQCGTSLLEAVRETLHELEGSYALLFLNQREPDRLILAKNATPIVIGSGHGCEMFVASDIPALLEYTRKVTFLEDGEMAEVKAEGYRILNGNRSEIKRGFRHVSWDALAAQKCGYAHFMLKEIHEQAQAITNTLRGRIVKTESQAPSCGYLDEIQLTRDELRRITKVHLVACGTSWHAALVGKFLIEDFAQIPTEVDYGSEFRYRSPLVDAHSLVLLISQSGETADTLAALDLGCSKGAKVVSICNVIDSTIARRSHGVFYTHAGPEIGVASTKAFTTQLTALYLMAIALGRRNERLAPSRAKALLGDALRLAGWVEEALELEGQIMEMTRELSHFRDFLYLGRGLNYPIALEGALKLKEISYIHAEGYPAGEMKHGPIALIDESVPVVVLLPRDRYYRKTLGNVKEVESRGGELMILTDGEGRTVAGSKKNHLVVPRATDYLLPVVFTIPLQLIAYYIAVHRGTDVDQPRNLAKSVTVE